MDTNISMTMVFSTITPDNTTCDDTCTEPVGNNLYVVLTAVMAGLSIFGGISICILYVVFKDLRTPGRKLLFFLALSDALLAFGNLLGIVWFLYSDSDAIHKSEGYCDFQSAMTIYFSITSFSWTVIMGISLFATVVLNKQNFTSTYMKLFHIIAWIPGAIIIVIALGAGVLGTDTTLDQASWCWIDPRVPNALVWQFATGKFFEILCYIETVVLYTMIKIFLARQSSKMIGKGKKTSKKNVIAEANRKLTFVPLVFIICRIWGTLRFLIGNFGEDIRDEPYVTWINPLQGIGDSAQGFANFVIYCFSTESIRQRMFPCFRNKVGIDEISGLDSKSNSRFTRKSMVAATDDRTCSDINDEMKPSATANVTPGVSFVVTETSAVNDSKGNLSERHTADMITRINPPASSAHDAESEISYNAYTLTGVDRLDATDEFFTVVNEASASLNEIDNVRHTSGSSTEFLCVPKPDYLDCKSNNKTNTVDKSHKEVCLRENKEKQTTGNECEVTESDGNDLGNQTQVVKSDDDKDESASDLEDGQCNTIDTGGVYLGTEETDPGLIQGEIKVQVTPPQCSDNHSDSVRTDSEPIQDNQTTITKACDPRRVSVTVDIHSRNASGLVEIAD